MDTTQSETKVAKIQEPQENKDIRNEVQEMDALDERLRRSQHA